MIDYLSYAWAVANGLPLATSSWLLQELLDNTALLREQMAAARALADKEQQEEYLRVKQMEAYERR